MDNSNYTIFTIDDEEPIRKVLNIHLTKAGFNVVQSSGGNKIFKELDQADFDILISDIKMPEVSGVEVLEYAQKKFDTVPVIMLTGFVDIAIAIDVLKKGAFDYITKPVKKSDLLATVDRAFVRRNLLLENKRLARENKEYQESLELKVLERTKELKETRFEIIRRLGLAAEYRDNQTGLHIERMSGISKLLAIEAGLLDEPLVELIFNASPMHDIGKIGIPDRILLKPGKLDKDEFEIMKTHAEIGGKILDGHSSDLMVMAKEIAISHHEKWDGSGYPNGLSGEDIPLSGRIVAIADVFDALTSVRPYKKSWSNEDALAEINNSAGKHFDPTLVEHFNNIIPTVIEFRENLSKARATSGKE